MDRFVLSGSTNQQHIETSFEHRKNGFFKALDRLFKKHPGFGLVLDNGVGDIDAVVLFMRGSGRSIHTLHLIDFFAKGDIGDEESKEKELLSLAVSYAKAIPGSARSSLIEWRIC